MVTKESVHVSIKSIEINIKNYKFKTAGAFLSCISLYNAFSQHLSLISISSVLYSVILMRCTCIIIIFLSNIIITLIQIAFIALIFEKYIHENKNTPQLISSKIFLKQIWSSFIPLIRSIWFYWIYFFIKKVYSAAVRFKQGNIIIYTLFFMWAHAILLHTHTATHRLLFNRFSQ